MSASDDPLVFQTTQRCHSVFSWRTPAWSFHVRLVARENCATRFPPGVDRISGSLPRFPISVTLFKLRLTMPPGEGSCLADEGSGTARSRPNQFVARPLNRTRAPVRARRGRDAG